MYCVNCEAWCKSLSLINIHAFGKCFFTERSILHSSHAFILSAEPMTFVLLEQCYTPIYQMGGGIKSYTYNASTSQNTAGTFNCMLVMNWERHADAMMAATRRFDPSLEFHQKSQLLDFLSLSFFFSFIHSSGPIHCSYNYTYWLTNAVCPALMIISGTNWISAIRSGYGSGVGVSM